MTTIAFTPGEPAGIGPDLAVMLSARLGEINSRQDGIALVCIADSDLVQKRAQAIGQPLVFSEWHADCDEPGFYIHNISCNAEVTSGQLNEENSAYVLNTLDRAIDGCLTNEFSALVTGPVHKSIINEANIPFTGHTEYLAARCGVQTVVMMLACESMRVALATTHVPLAEVSRQISQENLERILLVLHSNLGKHFGIEDPVISVCGLNPHAGEAGHLGLEEIDSIAPALEKLRQQGMKLEGPLPADTAFTPHALKQADAVLAMYHDQGLPVIKHACFGNAANITLGLPFIRTSVDHGTALDLAGSGQCDPGSAITAIRYAINMATK